MFLTNYTIYACPPNDLASACNCSHYQQPTYDLLPADIQYHSDYHSKKLKKKQQMKTQYITYSINAKNTHNT